MRKNRHHMRIRADGWKWLLVIALFAVILVGTDLAPLNNREVPQADDYIWVDFSKFGGERYWAKLSGDGEILFVQKERGYGPGVEEVRMGILEREEIEHFFSYLEKINFFSRNFNRMYEVPKHLLQEREYGLLTGIIYVGARYGNKQNEVVAYPREYPSGKLGGLVAMIEEKLSQTSRAEGKTIVIRAETLDMRSVQTIKNKGTLFVPYTELKEHSDVVDAISNPGFFVELDHETLETLNPYIDQRFYPRIRVVMGGEYFSIYVHIVQGDQ